MELFINLIILFFIFFTVFKRFKEVGKKQEEIKVPQSRHPGQVTEVEPITQVLKELGHRLEYGEQADREAGKSSPEPIFSDNDRFEEMQPEYDEPVAFEPSEIIPEQDLLPEGEERIPEVTKSPDHGKVMAGKEGERRYSLRFGGPEVVRGILMSEILGPPVSIRRESINK